MAAAEDLILQGLKILKNLKIEAYVAMGTLALAEYYTFSNQLEKAVDSLRTSTGMFRAMNMDYWLARTERASKMLTA